MAFIRFGEMVISGGRPAQAMRSRADAGGSPQGRANSELRSV